MDSIAIAFICTSVTICVLGICYTVTEYFRAKYNTKVTKTSTK